MQLTPNFPRLLQSYFTEWLVEQQNSSSHTISSYRDAWCLFLRFVAQRKKRRVADLIFSDLTAAEILAFLRHLEEERKVAITTRNCRLAALHSFFSFVAEREPLALLQCTEILRIPNKRKMRVAMCYLESDEIAAIIKQPDRKTLEGQRDHALLALLYNTGARIQEALDLCPSSIRFESPLQVRLIGKGKKERICPIWPETADLLAALLRRQPRPPNERLFVNRYGQPLGASGVRFKLRQYVRSAASQMPSLATKRISPHTFRHSTAVHLVSAGVDLTVIRSWMGHANLDTTNLYARANLETKRKALEQVDSNSRPSGPPQWKRDESILSWLESL